MEAKEIIQTFCDPTMCAPLLKHLKKALDGRQMRFMEVCGTHTVSIFQSGLRSILPEEVTHLSGPGCPVCVTHDTEVEAFIKLARHEHVILTTFGDLLRVPGPNGQSLKNAQAEGARIQIVYSPMDALSVAKKNPDDTVVFLGVGFETTAPTVAATILAARQQHIPNFCVLSFHKLVPPALRTLLNDSDANIDAFMLPGHVSTILGLEPYRFLASEYNVPSVVSGFEPADILLALCIMAKQLNSGKAEVVNAYGRAVNNTGNPKARSILQEVFRETDALWRGLGKIPKSGLSIRREYSDMDAVERFSLTLTAVPQPSGCKCGEILKGRLNPPQCPLFGKKCRPESPVGPCMVSTEGSCAAYFKYGYPD